jgi:acyl-CoA synthetase (AMP-forming)/AMP-acid ligase II
MNFVQTLRKRSELQPGVPALIDRYFSKDRVLTYSGLNRLVDFLSIQLREAKLLPGDRILFGLDPGQEMYGYLLAVLEVGGVPILYDNSKPHHEFISWVGALEPKFALIPKRGWIGAHFDAALKKIPTKIIIGRVRSQMRLLRLGKLGTLEESSPHAVALYYLVSEAPGHLALRAWSQSQLHESVQFLVSELKLKAGEIDLCASPLNLIANLAAGLTCVITCHSHRGIERQVEKFKPTRVAAESKLIRWLLRKSTSPLHRVFITNAPIAQEEVDFFRARIQRATIELIFCEDLPLAGVSLKEYEKDGIAALVGSFFSAVQAKVSSVETVNGAPAKSESEPSGSPLEAVGELLVRAQFLPSRQSLSDLSTGIEVVSASTNGVWHPTGVIGYFDDQSRFWLTNRISP